MAQEPRPPLKWEVRDPKGFSHFVEKDDDFVGCENLTHCVDDPMERPYILSMLLYMMEKHPDMGEWNGYAWMKR